MKQLFRSGISMVAVTVCLAALLSGCSPRYGCYYGDSGVAKDQENTALTEKTCPQPTDMAIEHCR